MTAPIIPDRYKLTVPEFRPKSDEDHSVNQRHLERWANSLPLPDFDYPNTVPALGDQWYFDGTRWTTFNSATQNFTPRIDQGVTTNITNTASVAEYRYLAPDVIHVCVHTTMGGAGTAGSAIELYLPVAVTHTVASAVILTLGAGFYFDNGVGQYNVVVGRQLNITNRVKLYRSDIVNASYMGFDPNFAIAANDQLSCTFTYRL